jgi:hypothetical protein
VAANPNQLDLRAATAVDGHRRAAAPGGSLGTLVADAAKDLSTLVRDEVALAKAEVKRDVKQAATGGGMFGVAAVAGLLAVIGLTFAATYAIHTTGLPLSLSWLVIGGAYLLLAAASAGLGLLRIKAVRGPKATKRTAGETVAVLKRPF